MRDLLYCLIIAVAVITGPAAAQDSGTQPLGDAGVARQPKPKWRLVRRLRPRSNVHRIQC